jgi:hypothetical protein
LILFLNENVNLKSVMADAISVGKQGMFYVLISKISQSQNIIVQNYLSHIIDKDALTAVYGRVKNGMR